MLHNTARHILRDEEAGAQGDATSLVSWRISLNGLTYEHSSACVLTVRGLLVLFKVLPLLTVHLCSFWFMLCSFVAYCHA